MRLQPVPLPVHLQHCHRAGREPGSHGGERLRPATRAGEGLGQARIAFGPFLILATIECLLLGRDVPGLFLKWIDTP